jgi:hypothetical protein
LDQGPIWLALNPSFDVFPVLILETTDP